MESAAFGGGRIVVSESSDGNVYTLNYFITDHLESTRAIVKADGTVCERNNYLPFGGRWEVSGSAISDNRFRFSGKEDQSSLGLPYSDFGARMLDKRIGRWISTDPAEQYHSGYVYCGNNPVRHVDPTGMWSITLTGQAAQEAFMLFKSMYGDDDPEERRRREMAQESRDRLDGLFDNAYNDARWSLLGFLHTAGKTLLDFLNPVGGIKSAGEKLDDGESLDGWDIAGVGADFIAFVPFGSIISKSGGAAGRAFFNGAKYSDKVILQMSKVDDIYHAFPMSVDGYATIFGQSRTKIGTDGKVFQWLEMPGIYNGKNGVFEYIKDANGIINHRYFRTIP